jgi:hypothetical protein
VFIAARTSTASKNGGHFGVLYPGVPLEPDMIATTSAWVYGLQQNAETRTNLGLATAGLPEGDRNTFRIDVFDGASGKRVNTIEGITLDSQGWVQIGNILAQYAPGKTNGYVHVTRTAGKSPFVAYGILNDGAQPGQRTGDGAFVSMQLDQFNWLFNRGLRHRQTIAAQAHGIIWRWSPWVDTAGMCSPWLV